jgi:hypothetical protein
MQLLHRYSGLIAEWFRGLDKSLVSLRSPNPGLKIGKSAKNKLKLASA